jgi:hypothetical protein
VVRELRQPWRGSVRHLGGGRGGEEVLPASDVEADVAMELHRRRGCGHGEGVPLASNVEEAAVVREFHQRPTSRRQPWRGSSGSLGEGPSDV